MQSSESLDCIDAHAFNEQANDLICLFRVNPDAVQRLLDTERLGATRTAEALHEAVAVAKEPEFLRLTITAMTCHLTLSSLSLTVTLYLSKDTTEGFGLWLRRASVCALARLCFYY